MVMRATFDVRIGDRVYPLVRDPTHVHPPELHRHLGTDTTRADPETALRRLLDAVEATHWFDDAGYIGRNGFGIGLAGHE
jgi:hypothetical protein